MAYKGETVTRVKKKSSKSKDSDTVVKPTVSVAGGGGAGVGVSQNVGGGTTIGASGGATNVAGEGSVGAAGGVGVNQDLGGGVSAGVGAGVNPQGQVSVGPSASYQISGDTNVSASAGYNSSTGNVGYGVGGSTHQGHNTYGVGYGATGFSGSVQIGDSKASGTGATVGGVAGGVIGAIFGCAACGTVIGSAAGSVIGGSGYSIKSRETDKRKRNTSALKNAGILDDTETMSLPDGSIVDFNKAKQANERDWYDSSRRSKNNEGSRGLYDYETDYTNDLDYLSGMLGISASRMTFGQQGKTEDQLGQLMGNGALGKVGYGQVMNKQNFDQVIGNHRAMYAKMGIDSKDEMISNANKMFADGRIKAPEYASMMQSADIVFDADFNKASGVMAGRWAGIESAGKTPSDHNQMTEA